jgi:hypothetical protein
MKGRMKMVKFITLIILLVLTGCSHSIRRFGYDMDRKALSKDTCEISFLKNMPTDTTKFKRIGRIKLGDTGFSTNCHEDDALRILRRDACQLGADAVNILNEKRPDFWSTCYRVEAEFLKKTNSVDDKNDTPIVIGNITTDDYKYNTDTSAVVSRVKNDKKRNAAIILGSCAAGFILGFLLTFHP